jgi:adenylate cyclase
MKFKFGKITIIIPIFLVSIIVIFGILKKTSHAGDPETTQESSYHRPTVLHPLPTKKQLTSEQYRDLLYRLVNPYVAREIIENYPQQPNGGKIVDVAIMFCDVSGFTTISEILKPIEVISLLNKFFEKVNTIASRHKGIINNFIGDAAMIVFGLQEALNQKTSNPQDIAQRAINAAQEIIEEVPQIKLKGQPLHATIGINYAKIVAGLLGAKNRYEYTMIGDGVNVASRLEGYKRDVYGNQYPYAITISQSVYDKLDGAKKASFDPLGRVQVKGRLHPIQIYGSNPIIPQIQGRRRSISAPPKTPVATPPKTPTFAPVPEE